MIELTMIHKIILSHVIAIIFNLILESKWYRTTKLIVTTQGEKFEGKYLLLGIFIRSLCPILNIVSMFTIFSISQLNDEELVKLLMEEYHNILNTEKSKSTKK